MIEARAFKIDIDSIRSFLIHDGAVLKGKYEIIDTIYAKKDASVSLGDEFLRLRVMPKNIWDEKDVIVSIKQTTPRNIGKVSAIPARVEFDSEEDAVKYVNDIHLSEYQKDFTFSRVGWQYLLSKGDVVDLEIIAPDYTSVEIKSDTDDGIAKLAKQLGIDSASFIRGPSVVEIKKLLFS